MLTLKDLLDNEYQNTTLSLNDKYYLYIERLEPVDGEEDILLEVFDKNTDECLFNTIDYIPHNFTSGNLVEYVLKYANEVVRLYERSNNYGTH